MIVWYRLQYVLLWFALILGFCGPMLFTYLFFGYGIEHYADKLENWALEKGLKV